MAVVLGVQALLASGFKRRAGTVGGIALVLLGIVWLTLGATGPQRQSLAREREKLMICSSFLKQIGICIRMYAQENGGQAPPSLEALSSQATPWALERMGHCPLGDTGTGSMFPHPDYEYCYRPVGDLEHTPSGEPLAWDRHVHRVGRRQCRNVVFVDSHVETLDEMDFQKEVRNF